MQHNCTTLAFSSSAAGGRQVPGCSPGGFHETEYSPKRLCAKSHTGGQYPELERPKPPTPLHDLWKCLWRARAGEGRGGKASSVLIMGDWDRTITGHQTGNVTLSALSFFLKLLLKLLMLCSFPNRREGKKIWCREGIYLKVASKACVSVSPPRSSEFHYY